MSNHANRRRDEERRSEHGPRYESQNPGEGSNSPHVARGRKKWKRFGVRSERRAGQTSSKFRGQTRVRPEADDVS